MQELLQKAKNEYPSQSLFIWKGKLSKVCGELRWSRYTNCIVADFGVIYNADLEKWAEKV